MALKRIHTLLRRTSQRYQIPLEPWHLRFVDTLTKKIDLRALHLLEIGCGRGELAHAILSRVPSATIHGIDSDLCGMAHTLDEESDSIKISVMDARNLYFPDNHFDACYSLNTLEHVGNLDVVYSELFRVLKPGSYFLASFGPIWTSYRGHHFRHWEPDYYTLIRPWAHLYLSQDEMREAIALRKGETVAEEALQYIYESDYLNRVPLATHEATIRESAFSVCEFVYGRGYEFIDKPTGEYLQFAARKSGIQAKHLQVDSLQVLLQKPDE